MQLEWVWCHIISRELNTRQRTRSFKECTIKQESTWQETSDPKLWTSPSEQGKRSLVQNETMLHYSVRTSKRVLIYSYKCAWHEVLGYPLGITAANLTAFQWLSRYFTRKPQTSTSWWRKRKGLMNVSSKLNGALSNSWWDVGKWTVLI